MGAVGDPFPRLLESHMELQDNRRRDLLRHRPIVEPPRSRSPSPEWIDSDSKPCHDTHSNEDATEIANKLEGICIATREPDNERIGSFENGVFTPHPSMR